jgi:dihydropteroate synthase
VRVRLLELQAEGDSLLAGQVIGRAAPEPNLRGWAALLPLEPHGLLEGLRQSGVPVLRGSKGAIALGSVSQLWSAGRSLADALEKAQGKSLAVELMLRAAIIESVACKPGLGPSAARMGDHEPPGWVLPRRALPTGRALIMGVVNVTADSFTDGGRFLDPVAAVEHGLQLAGEGADLLDVGGESTNPFGAAPVTAAEERRRIEPVIRQLARQSGLPVSIDTTKSEVAAAALDAGAEIVNDVSALARDPQMARLVAERGCALVLMHMRGTPADMQTRAVYTDLMGEVIAELDAALARAREAGVPEDHICLDPGLGFAKEAHHNYALLRRQRELLQLGRPLLVGPSRKSFIGKATGRAPGERLHGTLAAVALAAFNGAAIVRVHDVASVHDALAVADAVRNDGAGLV